MHYRHVFTGENIGSLRERGAGNRNHTRFKELCQSHTIHTYLVITTL